MNSFSDEGMRLADDLRQAWQRGGGPSKLAPLSKAFRNHLAAGEAAINELARRNAPGCIEYASWSAAPQEGRGT